MGKRIKTGGSSRYKKKGLITVDEAAPASQGAPLSRKTQSKVVRRVNFLEKVQRSALHAGVKKQSKSKKKGATLQSFSDFGQALFEAAATLNTTKVCSKSNPPKFRSSAARGKLQASEHERISAIWQAPAYKANPIAALNNFLEQTLPPIAVIGGKNTAKAKKNKKSAS